VTSGVRSGAGSPSAGSPRLPALDVGALDDERREVVQEVIGHRGRLPTPYRVWIASPGLARLLHPLGQFLARRTSLSKPEAEIAILAAARHWGADYVLAVHAREAREAGLSEDVVAAITAGRPAEPADPRQRALADMMAALSAGGGPPPERVFDAAVAALGHDGVAEAIAVAGYFSAVALAMKMYAVPPPAS
jgi:4-carboxymuconolactone decarboxylase